ncbi:MAG: UDP-N-acetylglucosamine--N-acetylmuramyl-(pentapeptide) pyrophosphoryl-undecaprenol N-acetylglucosamine transferase, partial [Chloroflexi bacterium]|nr:UDP-N-acetylglucosamine--N-acetylmuramyl-(pentapeptide) pyrophosphoryl-undecaprenol N-acetylglucosamine transferase [Chloroflexota bacterium]
MAIKEPRSPRISREVRVVLVGGGTGGHVSPLLAIAEALAASPRSRVLFVGGRRGLEADLVPTNGHAFHATPMPSLRDPDSRASLVVRGLLFPLAVLDSLVTLARFRPHVCCTTGGLVSFPPVLAARLLRVPVFVWEGNVVPGRANRALAGWAQRVGATFAASLPRLPRARTAVTGNPIRASLLRWTRDSGRASLGLTGESAVIFVTGGSQGAQRINEALFPALPRLLRRTAVIHHTGPSQIAKAEALRGTLPEDLRRRYLPFARLRDEMGAALASANLVIGRASSSSIAEPLAFGVPLVLVPFGAAADAHQSANARAVEESGAATVIPESELDPERLGAVVTGLLDDPPRLARMANAARA